LVTHGHHDQVGDLFHVARLRAPRIVELGNWTLRCGLRRAQTMNLGGVLYINGVQVVMTPAAHSSSMDDERT
jgi:L-ascorbate metabolism protein UlaG (beta-lactamase superfamily)